MKAKVYPKIEVIWADAEEQGEVGWNNLKKQLKYAKKPCPTIKNIGYEVYRDDNHISLLHSVGENECSSVEKIPISCIKDIILLKVEK
tara:strand:+ start:190 stop:453 length:264 start_codon:yes stop_codon:yes gene_type:complete